MREQIDNLIKTKMISTIQKIVNQIGEQKFKELPEFAIMENREHTFVAFDLTNNGFSYRSLVDQTTGFKKYSDTTLNVLDQLKKYLFSMREQKMVNF